MGKYVVCVKRITIEKMTLEIEADDWENAEDMALETAYYADPEEWELICKYEAEAEEL